MVYLVTLMVSLGGLGASYEFNNNVAVYVDYTELYNDDPANKLG